MNKGPRSVSFLFSSLLILMSLIGCSENKINDTTLPDADMFFLKTASSLREIAWNQLSKAEKQSVTGDWKEARVTIVQWDDVPLKKTSHKPESIAIYKVTFNTNNDKLIGPIGIYFNPVTKEVVGYDPRK